MPTLYCMVQLWQTLRNYSVYRTHLPESSSTRSELIIFVHSLHWLPINYRIDYKVASLVYKARSTGSPAYLQALVSDYMPTRQLLSSKQLFLLKPPVRTEISTRAFSQAAPTVRNDLPLDSLSAETYERFRFATKKHFYELAFTN